MLIIASICGKIYTVIKLKNKFLCIASGILSGIPFLFPSLSPLLFFSLVPFVYVLFTDESEGLCGFLFGIFYAFSSMLYIVTLNTGWLYSGILKYLLPIAAYVAMAVLEGTLTLLLCIFFGYIKKKAHVKLFPLTFSAAWILFEYVKGAHFLPTGYTLNRLYVPFAENTFFIQTVSVFGGLFISFVVIYFSSAFALFLSDKQSKRLFPPTILIILNLIFSLVLFSLPSKSDSVISVSAAQNGIDSHEKRVLSPAELTEIYSESFSSDKLVLFPEAAMPIYLNQSPYLSLLSEKASESGSAVIIGGLYKTDDNKSRTSLYLLSDNQIFVSSKRHPVPFGEYIPFLSLFSKDYAQTAIYGAEEEIHPLTSGNIRAGGIICFDSIFSAYAAEAVKNGANILCISTNDSWFHSSASAKIQLCQSIYRCIETSRYGVRSACTGISAVIDDKGKILSFVPMNEVGAASANVSLKSNKTLYTLLGDIPMLAFSFFIILFSTKKREKHDRY